MRSADLLRLSFEALDAHRLRYGLSALAVAVGVGAVVLMVGLGAGARRFVMSQINAFGTTIIGVHPGKVETAGIPGVGGSARRLTLDDARALARLPGVVGATPYAYGAALVEGGERRRRVLVQGVGGALPRVWHMSVAMGEFLPDQDWERGEAVAVLGSRLAQELFGGTSPLGARIRVADRTFRVLGVMSSKGTFLGLDMDDSAYLPVASAMAMFGLPELSEVHLLARSNDEVDAVTRRARELMIERHDRDDVTIVSPRDAVRMAGSIMTVLTAVVASIAGVSLLVGAIGILTILWIVVTERTGEVGLVRALGGTRGQILAWYLSEAAITAGLGGVLGLLGGVAIATLLTRILPGVEAVISPALMVAALGTAVTVGLLAGVIPALRASRLDPLLALRAD